MILLPQSPHIRRQARRTSENTPSERLSGNSLRGSDRAFLGSARRPKWYPFAPFRRLVRARNGASSEFPDSLSRNCLIIPGRAHYGPWRKPERVPKLPFRSLSWSPTRAPIVAQRFIRQFLCALG